MTYGSSTNDERINGERTDSERTDGAADARRTDDRTRTSVPEPSAAGAVPESAAGPRPVHAPKTAGNPADRADRNLATDRADRTGTTNAADSDRTGALGAKRDTDSATRTDRSDRSDRSDSTVRAEGVDRTDRTDGVDRTDRTEGKDRRDRTEGMDRTDRAGTHRETLGTSATSRTAGSAVNGRNHDGALLGGTDHDELERRMRHAVSDFVEDPQRAVREAGETLDAVTQNLVKALTERSTALRSEERADDAGGRNGERTEELRIVLQHYRDLTDRLLAV